MDADARASLLAAAQSLAQAGNMQGALDRARTILAENPDDVDALILSAAYLTDLGAPGEAVETAKRAATIDPERAVVYRVLSRARAAMGDGFGAYQDLKTAMRLAPEDPIAPTLYAHRLLDQRDVKSALAYAERAVKLAPDDVQALTIYSHVLLALGRVDDAERAARRAYEIAPENPAALSVRGHLAVVSGRHDEAMEMAMQAVARAPSDRGVLSLVAAVHLRRNPLLRAAARINGFLSHIGSAGRVAIYLGAHILIVAGLLHGALSDRLLIAGSGVTLMVLLFGTPALMRTAVNRFIARNKKPARLRKKF